VAVNFIPILRHLPSWMPGAGFQRFAAGNWTFSTFGSPLTLFA
jgi:hypothetical protein